MAHRHNVPEGRADPDGHAIPEDHALPEAQRAALTGYVEGFNAADAHRISARSLGIQQRAEEATDGDRVWHIGGGYGQLPGYLAGRVRVLGAEIRFGCEVVALRWQAGRVELQLRNGDLLTAPRCIITLPLGVLQQRPYEGGLLFEPEPVALVQARRLAMGEVVRFTLVFREAWWHRSPAASAKALQSLSFLLTPGEPIPVWWTARPEPEARPTLTGWLGGPRAAALLKRPMELLAQDACGMLARAFALPETVVSESLLASHTYDWSADPFARGAYSYVTVGALDAPAAMANPEAGTLFFAGEHTDTAGHWGTVHAAVRTGLRAAAQVLAAS